MLKSDGAQFLWKIHFCPNLGNKNPKIGYFPFFFEDFVIFSPESQCKMKVLLILDRPSQTPCLEKFMFWSNC